MPDWPRSSPPVLPLFVNAAARGRQQEITSTSNFSFGASTATTWVVRLISYMPVSLPWDYPVSRIWWLNGSTVTTTNVAFGIYTADGALIYNTGSVAMAGVSLPQYVAPATPFELAAGRYYFAWTCDNTTTRASTHAALALAGAMWGLLEETPASFGLPATMAGAVRWTRAFGYCHCGVTRTNTGF